ncbi:hypothetical protein SHXM_04190 [Streptomyces hygroscopicus]|nr:hypothetical protein SHXM_04190 [Streptomyces hygroscopicus]
MLRDGWHLTQDVDDFLARAGDFLSSRAALFRRPRGLARGEGPHHRFGVRVSEGVRRAEVADGPADFHVHRLGDGAGPRGRHACERFEDCVRDRIGLLSMP